jgi:hypothetical protein
MCSCVRALFYCAPPVRGVCASPLDLLRARQIDQEVPKTPIFVLFLLSHRH